MSEELLLWMAEHGCQLTLTTEKRLGRLPNITVRLDTLRKGKTMLSGSQVVSFRQIMEANEENPVLSNVVEMIRRKIELVLEQEDKLQTEKEEPR